MPTYIALLRGINVSGKNKLPMAGLRALAETLDFQQPKTYIQSGNLIFHSEEEDQKLFAENLSKGIQEKFGFDVPVLILSQQELEDILKNNPFLIKEQDDKLHVSLLAEEPSTANLKKLEGVDKGREEFVLKGKTLYLFMPDGYGRAKLTNNFLEGRLKVSVTTRNWKTMNMLAELAAASLPS